MAARQIDSLDTPDGRCRRSPIVVDALDYFYRGTLTRV
jgi:hypothetical protein